MKNPDSFQYKLSQDDNAQTGDLSMVQEFGVNRASKYVKATVDIDRSSQEVDKLTLVREPSFTNETLFLLVLVEGKANLYKYEDAYDPKYFYQVSDGEIKPMVYRKYITRDNRIGENLQFKQQLFNELEHTSFSQRRFSNISYNERELTKLFREYNTLYGADYGKNDPNGRNKDWFNLNIRPGLRNSSLVLQNAGTGNNATEYPTEIGFRLGIELEGILPFNKNKWSLFLEPSYQTYKAEKFLNANSNVPATVEYQPIEIAIGARHYMYLNANSKMFINAGYILAWSNGSRIDYNNGNFLLFENSSNFSFGLGYKYLDKYSLELNYNLDRGLLPPIGREAVFSGYSLIFGYTLF
ncbi:hypothetical protein NYZ99_20775 [Maribacter litopenaei]|uniref:Outer membrane protein beta-barrel domain-containing protein n=1 Tax=Maribacter litopenaei TaxID=2976127 RepID=A0ABY5Y9G8_9FLAO|nr:hypothetical protein [Maribacter litopenaei]UWX55080.1 hypothetical protein NYZ99_20775 [Maribacter litopenaei]